MRTSLLFCLILASLGVSGQVVKATRLTSPIVFDGIVNEDEWEGIPQLPLIQFVPVNGSEMNDRSEMYMAYDDDYLYLAGRLFNKSPADIMGQSYKRDIFTYASDYFGLIIDQFNDNENAVCFATSPKATRTDWLVFNDAMGDFPLNENWNTFWDSRTSELESGWQSEIRIPWSSLRFNVVDGKTTMGIIYWRHIAKTGEDHTPPGMKNTYGGWSVFKPSQGVRYEFEGLKSTKPLYVAPYVLGGFTQQSEINAPPTGYHLNTESQYNAGLDVKFSPSSNLTMDLTFNTDFAQVEADDQQVNLTRFSLFFPEKRMFFQERSSTFLTVPNVGFNRIFYSRRIGLEDGNTVPIIAGARLVGRIGKWDIGFLDMQTAAIEGVESANHGVVRLRKQAFNKNSNLGMIVTNKTDFGNDTNISLGVDGNINVIGKDFFRFGLSSTHNAGVSGIGMLDLSKIYLQWQNTGSQGFGYDLVYARVGEGYDPVMGFELRNDITNYNPQVWYAWIMGEESIFLSHEIRLQSSLFTRNSDNGVLETGSYILSIRSVTKPQAEFNLNFNRTYDDVLESFDLSETDSIPVGSYAFNNMDFRFATPQGQELVFTGTGQLGQYYDGNITKIGGQIDWKPSAVINGLFIFEHNRIKAADRGMDFVANIGRIKGEFTFNTKWSAAAFYQFSDAAHFSLMNFRLRYNPREGNDFYLVYNEGMNLDRSREIPVLPVTDTRTLLLKYTHTFVW